MKIETLVFAGEGMLRVYENEKWTIGVKNFKPANSFEGFDSLERHNKTDELFVLLAGECSLVYANEEAGGLSFGVVKMLPEQVYNIPAALWHNTITKPGTKLVLVEDSNTTMDNSDILQLSPAQLQELRDMLK